MVNYPISLDTDAEIPRVEDALSDLTADVFNALRAAVFAIEKALGVRPQGTASDLVNRLNVSLNSNGTIKASALSGIGLVTLPITDAQVGTNAGIEESKLDLDYATALLKSWIDSLRVRVDALEIAVANDIANLNQHIDHPSTYGRHETDDIDATGIFSGSSAQTVLVVLAINLQNHIIALTGAHNASAIALDPNPFSSVTATDVQHGMEQLEDVQLTEIVKHRDRHHSNGILGTQDSFVDGTNRGVIIIDESDTTSASIGDTFIKFLVAPSPADFQTISKNDRIDFIKNGTKYSFIIESTQGGNQVNIFGSMPISGFGTAIVYKNTEETFEPSVGILCMKQDTISPRPSTLQIVHPSAPYILSSGFRGSSLSTTARNIRISYPKSYALVDTGDLDVYTAMLAFSTVKSTWTAENVAKVINTSLFSPGIGSTKHPLIAFSYKGELGIAYSLPHSANGYSGGLFGSIEITTPSSNNATTVLGFTIGTSSPANYPRSLYIDGYEFDSISLLLDAQGLITSSDTITFPSTNPLALGVQAGQIARIFGASENGYIINSVTSGTITFDSINEYDFTAAIGEWVSVKIYADTFSLTSAPALRTLYEVFLDGYDDAYGPVLRLRGSERVEYTDTSGGGSSLEGVFDLTAVSRTFAASSKRMYYNGTTRTVTLGDPAVGPTITNPGASVTLPLTNEQGFRFTLYDTNGTDYVEFEIISGLPGVGSTGYLDITIYPRISEERFLQVGTVLHNLTRFRHLTDTREFGNVGRYDIRDDFTRDYVSFPRSLIRGNGVIYGCVASGTGTTTLTVTGGEVLVNGQIKSTNKASFAIPADSIAGTTYYNLFVDTNGVLQLLRNDYFAANILSTPSIAELLESSTETAIAQIGVSVTNTITSIKDLRRFVNSLDDKSEILVEEGNVKHGSFSSINSAVDYLNSLPSDTKHSRTIRIRGEVFLLESVTLPENIILVGDGYMSDGTTSTSSLGSRITYADGVNIFPSDGTIIRDLGFFHTNILYGFLYASSSLSNFIVERCTFQFGAINTNNVAITCQAGLTNAKIDGNFFYNVGTGIEVRVAANIVDINNNFFSGVFNKGIYLYNTENVNICNNYIISQNISMSSSTSYIYMGEPSGYILSTNIIGNYCVYTGSQVTTASCSMINISETDAIFGFLSIEHNIFGNSISGTGFGLAIGISTGSTFSIGAIIRDNLLSYFSHVTYGSGIVFDGCTTAVISNNIISDCSQSLFLSDVTDIAVSGNIIYNDLSDASLPSFLLQNCSDFTVTDNHIYNSGTAALLYVVSIGNGVICNNSFITGTANTSMVSLVGTGGITFNNNIFTATALTGPTYPPLRIFTDNTLIVGNSFYIGSNAAANCIIVDPAATGVVEQLNKGQKYSVWIPVDRAICESQWAITINSSIGQLLATTTDDGYNIALIDFSVADVPTGALLDSATVYFINSGAFGDISFELYSEDFSTLTFTSLSAIEDADPFEFFKIIPTDVIHYMLPGSNYNLIITGKDGTSAQKLIFGMTVNYTL